MSPSVVAKSKERLGQCQELSGSDDIFLDVYMKITGKIFSAKQNQKPSIPIQSNCSFSSDFLI